MKLHLPKMLTAALIAAFAVTGAYAGVIDQNSILNLDDNITYNGKIYTMSAGTGVFSGRSFTEYVQSGGGMAPGQNTTQWKSYASNQNGFTWGHTLRLASIDANASATSDFSPFSLGGLIVEAGTGTHTIGRNTGNGTKVEFNGVGDVNLHIKGSVNVLASSDPGITFYKGGKWLVEEGKVLTFNTSKQLTLNDGIAVNIAGKGSVSVTGNLVTGAGATIKVDADSRMDVTGTTTLGGTITNNGTIQFATDTVTLGSLAGFESSAMYTNYTGGAAGNGFAGTIEYTIIKGEGESNLAKVNYGDQQAVELSGGKLTVEGDVDYTKYYLVTDNTSMSVKAASDFAAEHEGAVLSTVYVKGANDTVNVDMNFGGTVEASATGAILNIQEGYVFSGTASGVALKGAGTYALSGLNNVASSLGTNVTLDNSWTGTVKFSSCTILKNINLNNLGKNGSSVEFDGVTGYFDAPDGGVDFTNKLVLSGSGLEIVNGSSPRTYTFSGGVSGSGNFIYSMSQGATNQTYVFNADVAGWTGAFKATDGRKTGTLSFVGGATAVNASIVREAGTLNVEIGDGENSFSTTFNKGFGATKLTVKDKATATFKGETSIGALAGDGSLVVDAATHNVAIGGGTIAKTITLKAGTLSLAGAYNLDGLTCEDYHFEYVGGEDISDGNGFRKASGTVQVADMQGGTLSVATDATFSYKEDAVAVDTTTGVGSITSDVDYTTFYANTGSDSFKAAWAVAQSQPEPQEITTVVVADKASIFMDMHDASIALKMTGDATVEADWRATITSVEGWSGNTLTISGSETITTPQSVVLDEEGDALVVDERATLAITGNNSNLTLQHGTATVLGIVNINHELDLSKNKTSDAKLVIATDGEVTANGMWMHQGGSIELDDNGRFAIGNLIFRGQGDTSTITYNDDPTKDSRYTEENNKYVITDTTIIASGDATIGLTLNNCDVETGFNTVTLNSNAAAVTINDGGVFHQGDGVEVNKITVEDGGTVGNGVDVSQAEIVRGATAMYVNNLADSDVTFYQGTDLVTVTNETGTQAAYTGIGQANMKVTADKLGAVAGQDVTVANKVVVNSILNLGEALTLTHVDTDVLNSIDNYGGQVTLLNVSGGSFELSELSLFTTIVAAYTDSTSTTEATVTITDALIAGGGTLLANLTLVGNSTLDVNGGDASALTLGSLLTVDNSDGLVNLDDATLAAISGLNEGDRVTLVKGLNGTSFSTNLTHGEEAGLHFNLGSINGSDYMVFVTDSAMGIEKTSSVPEPTTGTLSLLALMALAARRRRK